MPLLFTPDDLDAQARLRDAFDPDGAANPMKVLPRGQPLRRAAARAGGRVDLSDAIDVLAASVATADAVVAGRRADTVGDGGPAA